MEMVKEARKKFEEIHAGKEGHWFDLGEYEFLKQEFFDKYASCLLSLAENTEDMASDLRKAADQIALLAECCFQSNLINMENLKTQNQLADKLRKIASNISPEPSTERIYKEHLDRLRQLRTVAVDNESRYLDDEIADMEKKLIGANDGLANSKP